MSRSILKAWTVLAISGSAGLSAAATLLVPNDHATVGAALTAAAAGDTIEITNSSTYIENLYVTKDNITIQGQAGLSPAPLIQGVSAAHPLAGAPAGATPEKWNWTTGAPTSRNTWFDQHGAAVVNASTGLTLRNLRISSDPAESRPVTSTAKTAGVLDFRFGTSGLVDNCVLDGTGPGAIGAERLVMSANAHTFQNVTFQNGRITIEQMGGPGTLQLTNCAINGQQHALWINGGTFQATGTTIDSSNASGGNLGAIVRNEYGPSDVTFSRCVFRKSSGAGMNAQFMQLGHVGGDTSKVDDWGTGRWSPGTIDARFDQCDFVGGPANQVRYVAALNGGRSSWIVRTLRFTGCNFYNIHGNVFNVNDFPIPGNAYKAGGTVDRFEDFNVFKMAQNTAPAVGMESGGNSITLAGDPLYVDPAGGNFQLASNSPAATLKGTATPPYTGALGVSATSVAPNKITVGHSGADYTSINAAIAAATEGALIEITDNSAPYVEDILLNATNGLTLQGAPSLSPRPTIQGNSATTNVVRLASPSRNVTLRNLILDGTALSVANAMTLDIRDVGETVVENCHVIGGPSVAWTVFAQYTRIMRDCVISGAANRPAVQQNLSGNFLLADTQVQSAGKGLNLEGGMFLVHNSHVRADGTETIVIGYGAPVHAQNRNSYLDIRDSVITSNAGGAPANGNNLIIVRNVNARRTVVIDNSDLVGSMQAVGAGQSPTGTAIWVVGGGTTNYPITYMNVTDSIFFNTAVYSIYFQGNTATNTIPGLVFDPTAGVENYNAFKWSPEAFAAQGITQGANDINLDGHLLYYNAPFEFRILSSSPAATHNSTGTPAYLGSQGVFDTGVTSAEDWALYQ